jgi:uncharacterized cupredoxin-like copper-binding protein
MTAVASFALVVLAACGGGGEVVQEDVTRVAVMSDAAAQATEQALVQGSPVAAEGTPTTEAPGLAAADATPVTDGEPAAAASVEVVSFDIYFEPAELTIPANTDVTVALPNEGVILHNFSIDELGIDVDIEPGETQEAAINAAPGEYEYYCNVPGHKEAGMVGTLIVTEEAAATPTAAEEAPATPAAAAATAEAPTEATPPAAAEPVEIVSFDIYFEPSEVTIPANTDVIVMLPNEGVTLHNFAIDALGIDVDIAPGETQEAVINAPAGTYEFYCNVPGHKEAGMVGTLIVSEDVAPAAPAAAEQAAAATPAEVAAPAAPAAASPPVEAAAPAASAEPVEVVSFDIYFEPNELTIPANTDVTVTLRNEGVTLHNFAIDELGIDVDIAPGETQESVINAPAGTYEFYCNVPGHKEAGMVGTLIVVEDAAAQDAATTEAAPAAEATPAASAETAPAAAVVQPVDIAAGDIFFEPTEISVPANTDVPVIVTNNGAALHNFSIDGLDIDVDIAPGETQEVIVNAAPGEYEYYCNVPGHKPAGMVGTLIVEDAAAFAAAAQAAASPETATPAAATPAAAASAEVVSFDIYFEPTEVTIPADTDVTFTLPNEGVTMHNFAIDELGIDIDIAPGETQETVINAPAGTYEFYCNVPGHKPAGMVGTLIVE